MRSPKKKSCRRPEAREIERGDPRGEPGDAEKTRTLTRENEILRELLPKGPSLTEIQGHLAAVADGIRAAANEGQATGVAMKHLKSLGVRVSGADVALAVRALRG